MATKQILVDLHSTEVTKDKNLWIVHPGRNREYFEEFEQNNCIFLGFPDLNLTPITLASDDAVRQRIRYSQAIRANSGLVREDGSTILTTDYPGYADKDVAIHLRTIRHLTSRIMPHDVVVVPGRGAEGRVLFGEVVSQFSNRDRIRPRTLPYADVPVRRVQ